MYTHLLVGGGTGILLGTLDAMVRLFFLYRTHVPYSQAVSNLRVWQLLYKTAKDSFQQFMLNTCDGFIDQEKVCCWTETGPNLLAPPRLVPPIDLKFCQVSGSNGGDRVWLVPVKWGICEEPK